MKFLASVFMKGRRGVGSDAPSLEDQGKSADELVDEVISRHVLRFLLQCVLCKTVVINH